MLLRTAQHGWIRAYEVLHLRQVCDDGAVSFAAHLERFFPGTDQAVIAPSRAPTEDRLPGFRVWQIAPGGARQPWLYATCGAAPDGEDGAEYVLMAPAADPAVADLLGAVALVNADSQEGLGVGSVVALGRPWNKRSFANHLLVLPPYAFDPDFAVHEDGERRVVVLWLVPIMEAEAQHAREQGWESLSQLIESSGANVVNPLRPSVV